MATKHVVHFRIAGGKSLRRNVITKQDGTPEQCRDQITAVLAAEYQVEPRQVQLLDRAPEPAKPKQKAADIRKLTKSQCLDLIESDPQLVNISTDGTAKEIEDRIIAALGLTEA